MKGQYPLKPASFQWEPLSLPGAHTKLWGSFLTLLLLSDCISNLVRRSYWFILQKISNSDCVSPPAWLQPWSKPTSFFTLNTTKGFLIGSFLFTYIFSLRVHSHQKKKTEISFQNKKLDHITYLLRTYCGSTFCRIKSIVLWVASILI